MTNYKLICIDCDREYKRGEILYVCPECAKTQKPMHPTRGVLRLEYNYDEIRKSFTQQMLGSCEFPDQRRYIDLLPIDSIDSLPPLPVGPTPLNAVTRVRESLGLKNLYVKNDTCLPTGSFKDRASSLVVAVATEMGKTVVTTASTGNAATALAGMCASVGKRSVIFVPATAPVAKLTQIAMFGAELIPINGTYDDAFELTKKVTAEFGWYNRNTAYNPMTVEGKKTAALEIWEQLGNRTPDKIFIPTGDGVILAGLYKGFYDLKKMGLVAKIPKLIPVQAEGSAAIVDAIDSGSDHVTPLAESKTIADSISVSAPANANWVLKIVKETDSFGIKVSDAEILFAIKELATLSGIFAEPAAAAAYAGLVKVKAGGKVNADETIITMITGNGLKDIPTAQKAITIPEPIEPTLEAVVDRVGG